MNFIAITQPSRLDVQEYRDYLDDISAVVGRINAKYANVETGWHPIQLIMGDAQACGQCALRIEIHQQHLTPQLRQTSAKVNRGGGLAHSALLVHH